MKRLLLAAVLSLSVSNVLAAGAYDGIYQYGLNPAYYSVHQNGNTLLIASMGFVSIGEDVRFRIGRQEVAPRSMGFWDYSMGTINGSRARVTGIGLFGACEAITDISFDEFGGVTATLVSYANTALGTSQGVNCATVLQDVIGAVGRTIALRRIF